MYTTTTNYIRMTICMFVVLCALSPVSPQGVRHVEAQQIVHVVSDTSNTGILNLAKNTLSEISNAITAKALGSLTLKEFALDQIAWNIAQKALNEITSSMIEWINSGFNGKPGFVTNLEDHLLSVADDVVDEFISGGELDTLCQPIKQNVKTALETQYQKQDRKNTYTPQCTVGGSGSGSAESFLSGESFSWNNFFELAVGGNNDQFKAFFNAQQEMVNRAEEAEELEKEELRWGDGFLPKEACEQISSATGISKEHCQTVTPGALIRDALAFAVGELPSLKLVEADEIDEIISALISQLTNQMLEGTFGLLGLGGNSSYSDNSFGSSGSQSYTQALRSEDSLAEDSSGVAADAIADAIATTEERVNLLEQVVNDVRDLETRLSDGAERYPECFDLTLSSTLADNRDDAAEELSDVQAALAELRDIQTRIENAASSQEQQRAYDEYLALEASGVIPTARDNEVYRTDFIERAFEPRVEDFNERIDDELEYCEEEENEEDEEEDEDAEEKRQ